MFIEYFEFQLNVAFNVLYMQSGEILMSLLNRPGEYLPDLVFEGLEITAPP